MNNCTPLHKRHLKNLLQMVGMLAPTSLTLEIPDDLASEQATITVFDNGVSMDESGLRELWHIAFSPKTNSRIQHGRQMVGKFGIGKLATYVLANRLTYICKAEDQVIRRVTMDYGEIDRRAEPDKLISQLNLEMFEVTDDELTEAVLGVAGGAETLRLISGESEVPTNDDEIDSDFGAEGSILSRNGNTTWTLVGAIVKSGVQALNQAAA